MTKLEYVLDKYPLLSTDIDQAKQELISIYYCSSNFGLDDNCGAYDNCNSCWNDTACKGKKRLKRRK